MKRHVQQQSHENSQVAVFSGGFGFDAPPTHRVSVGHRFSTEYIDLCSP
ncbi:hypothetical protein [Azospirillum doebereinerae]